MATTAYYNLCSNKPGFHTDISTASIAVYASVRLPAHGKCRKKNATDVDLTHKAMFTSRFIYFLLPQGRPHGHSFWFLAT